MVCRVLLPAALAGEGEGGGVVWMAERVGLEQRGSWDKLTYTYPYTRGSVSSLHALRLLI